MAWGPRGSTGNDRTGSKKGLNWTSSRFVWDFDQFYLEHYRSVVALVYTLTGSRHGAEDIAQARSCALTGPGGK